MRRWLHRLFCKRCRTSPDPFDDFEEFQLMRWREEQDRSAP